MGYVEDSKQSQGFSTCVHLPLRFPPFEDHILSSCHMRSGDHICPNTKDAMCPVVVSLWTRNFLAGYQWPNESQRGSCHIDRMVRLG